MEWGTRERFDADHEVRIDGQIHRGAINLDGLTEMELAIASEHPALHHDVRLYAQRALAARKQRLAGNIQEALKLEACCEWLYQRMPSALRW